MENEIKVGEYCRTKDGYISQVTEIDHYIWFNSIIYKESGIGCYELSRVEFKNLVVKHSSNLIDLIQCGDYVNGEKVCKSRYDELYTSYVYCGGIGVRTTEAYTTFIKDMKEEEIETIVTKEQFESISYKVKTD